MAPLDNLAQMPDRVASFAGSMTVHTHMAINGGVLQAHLEGLCRAVVAHLLDVTQVM